MRKKTLIMSPKDNVAVALNECIIGDTILNNGNEVIVSEPVHFGHKIAIADIQKNQNIIKYGEIIGYALKPIVAGEWIHVHNMGCHRGKDK